jgi:hypothetical protein
MQRPKRKRIARVSCYFSQGVLKYPIKLGILQLGQVLLDNPKDGEQLLREKYIGAQELQRYVDSTKIIFFKIQQDSKCRKSSSRIWIYDRNGFYLGHNSDSEILFQGRDPETLRFESENLVQFITEFDQSRLQLGIILGVPFSKIKASEVNRKLAPAHLDQSDNRYAVYLYSGETIDHYHLPECYIFEPDGEISCSERKKLISLVSVRLNREHSHLVAAKGERL